MTDPAIALPQADQTNGATQPKPTFVRREDITLMCKQPLTIMARGITGLLAHLNYEQVILCFAEACGELCAETAWCNDVLYTLSLRKKISEAFERGMKRVPSMQPGPRAAAAQAAMHAAKTNGA